MLEAENLWRLKPPPDDGKRKFNWILNDIFNDKREKEVAQNSEEAE